MRVRLLSGFFFVLGLSSCGSEYIQEEMKTEFSEDCQVKGMGKFLGEDVLVFGGPKKREQESTSLGVNSHLWRASLDTISFMPIASADPFGGVIITDWYSPPQAAQERFKVNVLIRGRDLRADGVKVSVFRQTKETGGAWVDAAVAPATA